MTDHDNYDRKSESSGINAAQYNKIHSLLASLRNEKHDVDAEIKKMIADNKKHQDTKESATWTEVFASKKAVIIGCGLMFFQVSH